jgi:hypothetical protein
VALIVAFRSFCLNVLLNCIDLRLVSNQSLFNFVKSIVDVALKYLVLTGVMANSMIVGLLTKFRLILIDEASYQLKSNFLRFKLTC